jgi:replicative DNA helicase
MIANIPPQNIEAEAAVLGAALLNKEAMDKVADLVLPPDFYRPDHQTIYRAILRLYEKNSPIDLVMLVFELEEVV